MAHIETDMPSRIANIQSEAYWDNTYIYDNLRNLQKKFVLDTKKNALQLLFDNKDIWAMNFYWYEYIMY